MNSRNSKATLVVMAAGIGSRYGGGIKQLAPVGPNGEIIMDYSIYDALEAGFDNIVFVIRRDIENDFIEIIGRRIEKMAPVSYVFQETDSIPEQFVNRFSDRTKPWGTGQAVLCCKDVVASPFLVINADDYYGKEAFRKAYAYLTHNGKKDNGLSGCMVGFVLGNTLSENGAVTRGVCKVGEDALLADITETKGIISRSGIPVYEDETGEHILDKNCPVSMNMWGLTTDFFPILEAGFTDFLSDLSAGDNKKEYLLPIIIKELLSKQRMVVHVLRSSDRWFGMTYKEDKDAVALEIRKLIDAGAYPIGGLTK